MHTLSLLYIYFENGEVLIKVCAAGLNRADIFIATAGDENTAGEEQAGSDTVAGGPSPEARSDSPLNGAVTVSVDIEDEAEVVKVRRAFGEFEAAGVSQS